MLLVEDHAEHQHLAARRSPEQLARQRHARGRPEQHVEDHEIRILGVDERARLGGRGGLADDLEIGLRGQQGAQPLAEQTVIVDESNFVAHDCPLTPNAAEGESLWEKVRKGTYRQLQKIAE